MSWFHDRIGKRVYRTKGSCLCVACTSVYENGIVIEDAPHASLLKLYSEEIGVHYFDTQNEVREFEERVKTYKPRTSHGSI